VKTRKTIYPIVTGIIFLTSLITACGVESDRGSNSQQDTGGSTDQQEFSGSATLSWDSPATNADGTTLTDLVGYKVYYGTTSLGYTTAIDINDPNTTTHTIQNLSPGTYYFAVKAYDTSINESEYSSEVSKTIN